jgi:effector-binding domain-containing protein
MAPTPRIEQHEAQSYVGIRAQVSLENIGTVLPPLFPEVFGWLAARSMSPAGAPFVRYHVIKMPGFMDVEVGVPVESAPAGDERVRLDMLPGGEYAVLHYTGHPAGLFGANAALQAWGRDRGVTWAMTDTPRGEEWAARVEYSLTDPTIEPDMNKWGHEVAYRVAERGRAL